MENHLASEAGWKKRIQGLEKMGSVSENMDLVSGKNGFSV